MRCHQAPAHQAGCAAGFQQAPVVITPDNSWTGYRPDLIREVAQQVAADNRAAATVSA